MSAKEFFKKALDAATENAPAIFTGLAVAGVIGTVVSAANAGIKAERLIMEHRHEKALSLEPDDEWYNDEYELTTKEKIKASWTAYIPPVLAAGFTITCIICAHKVSATRLATMCTLYSMSEDRVKALRDKIEEKLPPSKARLVDEEATGALSERHPYSPDKVIATGTGTTLVYDANSGRYFYSDKETIRQAENDINSELINSVTSVTLNELYYMLKLSRIKLADDIGWDTDHLLSIRFGSKLMEDGTPCMVIDYTCKPIF